MIPDELTYEEKISSLRTEVLFVALAILFTALLVWRVMNAGFDLVSIAFLIGSIFFAFYATNYRRLVIRIFTDGLSLKFGLFSWRIPRRNIDKVMLDETSLWRIGGAGIHFSIIDCRYRAMWNFLEYPRIVVALKKKKGLVRDIAFSTKRPEEIMCIIKASVAKSDVD